MYGENMYECGKFKEIKTLDLFNHFLEIKLKKFDDENLKGEDKENIKKEIEDDLINTFTKFTDYLVDIKIQ